MVGKIHKKKALAEAKKNTDKPNDNQNSQEKVFKNDNNNDDHRKAHRDEHNEPKLTTKSDVSCASDDENDSDNRSLAVNNEANVSKAKKRKLDGKSGNKNDKLSSKSSNTDDNNEAAAAAADQNQNCKSTSDSDTPILKEKRNKKSIIAESSATKTESEEEDYEVEDIIGHKVKNGTSYFLIRWKGYTEASDTWEPEQALSCKEIIEKFRNREENVPNNEQKSTNKKRKRNGSKIGRKSTNKNVKADANKEWEVEKIIDYGEGKNGRLFRIRWKGFSAKYDTWEPEENLKCASIIEKFMTRMESLRNITFKELRETPKKTKRLINETIAVENLRERKSKRSSNRQRVFYGYMDE